MDYYYDGVEVPGSQLNIRFYGDEKTSKQIFIILFTEGGECQVFRGEGGCGIIGRRPH
jgi:hypothetical protein